MESPPEDTQRLAVAPDPPPGRHAFPWHAVFNIVHEGGGKLGVYYAAPNDGDTSIQDSVEYHTTAPSTEGGQEVWPVGVVSSDHTHDGTEADISNGLCSGVMWVEDAFAESLPPASSLFAWYAYKGELRNPMTGSRLLPSWILYDTVEEVEKGRLVAVRGSDGVDDGKVDGRWEWGEGRLRWVQGGRGGAVRMFTLARQHTTEETGTLRLVEGVGEGAGQWRIVPLTSPLGKRLRGQALILTKPF